jgi:hypothetical protein
MRTNPYKWVNSAVPAAEDSTDWRKWGWCKWLCVFQLYLEWWG